MIASLPLLRHPFLILPLILVALSSSVHAENFTGPVVAVSDSDTLEILHNHHPERIRLNGIDCTDG